VHVFARGDGTWRNTLIADGATTSARFGAAFDVDGDLLLVGADRGDVDGSPDGTASVFRAVDGIWGVATTLSSGESEAGESFGNAIALDGQRALVGAIEDDGDGRNAGAAYVLE
jgi:hypothetical protein